MSSLENKKIINNRVVVPLMSIEFQEEGQDKTQAKAKKRSKIKRTLKRKEEPNYSSRIIEKLNLL